MNYSNPDSLYESFNARAASPEDLAKGFIASVHFEKVIQPAHTLVLGPRGSGKTSLLKMLQPRSLAAWTGKEANSFKSKMDYIGVYIPTDISWGQQLKNLGSERFSDSERKIIEWAAVTTHVLHSLLTSLLDRLDLGKEAGVRTTIQIRSGQEVDLVRSLATRWALGEIAPTLISLKHALLARSNDIWRYATTPESFAPSELALLKRALSLDFLREIPLAIEVINDATKGGSGRWALLFDELEIAPQWMVERLVGAMRSVDQRLLLKLSASPYTDVEALLGNNAPRAGQDYDVVRLWYEYKSDGRLFCQRLFKSVLVRNGIEGCDPESILGSSLLKGTDEEKGRAYKMGSVHHKLLLAAYDSDSSFRAYCDKNRIDFSRIDELSESKRASVIRKIVPSLIVRQAFRKADDPFGAKIKKRSRKKASEVYSGSDTFFEMLEGNPRWLLGMVGDMIPLIRRTGKIPRGVQLDLLVRTAERFKAILQTIPLGRATSEAGEPLSLLDALDAFGKTIYRSVVLDAFRAEPYGIIRIDRPIPAELHDSLGVAINAGALVPQFSNVQDLLHTKLSGRCFRLTYLLSPDYHIPVRRGRVFPASKALAEFSLEPHRRIKRSKRSTSEDVQLSLSI